MRSTCWPTSLRSWSACSCSRACGNPAGGNCSRSSATDLVYAPWTSAAERWAGFGFSASGSAPPATSWASTSTRRLLDAARSFLDAERITNVELVVDDLFDSKQAPQSFDLVHARFQIAPLGRGPEQLGSHKRLVRPGGSLVLEEWDLGSWHFNPPAPAAERLIRSIREIFADLGGETGRELPELLRGVGFEEPEIDAHVIALKPGHPYLRMPLQFSVALEPRLLETLSEDELASLRREAEGELAEPGRWGTTFTLIQSWGRLEG